MESDEEGKKKADFKDFVAMYIAVLINLLPIFAVLGILALVVLALSSIHF